MPSYKELASGLLDLGCDKVIVQCLDKRYLWSFTSGPLLEGKNHQSKLNMQLGEPALYI